MPIPKLKLELSKSFLSERKEYIKNNKRRFQDYKKAILLFGSNPTHPSLNIEKLQNAKGVYTIRLNKSDRIFFAWGGNKTATLIDIGKHDKYRRY